MSRRYVFWRDSTGKPYKKDDDKFAFTHILRDIGRGASVKEGKVSWQGFSIIRLEAAFKSSFAILAPDGEELNERDSWQIARTALSDIIRDAGGGKALAPRKFIECANHHARIFFRKPLEPYALRTTVSIDGFPAKSIRIGSSVIEPLGKRRGRYPFPQQLRDEWRDSRFKNHLSTTKYCWVRVRASGRTIHDAVDRMLTDLTLLRGLWSLLTTYGSWSISSGSTERKGIGAIHNGPVHTLHRYPSGELVDDIFWFEPEYRQDVEVFKPKRGWAEIEKHRRQAERRLRRLPYRRELKDLIVRYTTALDQPNMNVAFLHLWGILEKVTDTVGAQYDVTIKRSSWFYRDRGVAREMIESLRLVRNRFVHSSRAPADDADQVVYLAKLFVEPHLARLLWNDLKVGTLKEYGRFLSMPTNVEALERTRQKYALAGKMLRRWEREREESAKKAVE